jgi:hypothetical protein
MISPAIGGKLTKNDSLMAANIGPHRILQELLCCWYTAAAYAVGTSAQWSRNAVVVEVQRGLRFRPWPPLFSSHARVAELVDATDLKSVIRKSVRVQVPLRAPRNDAGHTQNHDWLTIPGITLAIAG